MLFSVSKTTGIVVILKHYQQKLDITVYYPPVFTALYSNVTIYVRYSYLK